MQYVPLWVDLECVSYIYILFIRISLQRLSFVASTTASFATTMGTVPVGPVSVRTRTPDTTALATITVSVSLFFATVISVYLLCPSVKAIHLYKSVPCISVLSTDYTSTSSAPTSSPSGKGTTHTDRPLQRYTLCAH